jgi:hypothetical protein
MAGLLAAPMLAFDARAITYTDETWTPVNLLPDGTSAAWDDFNNWSLGVVPVEVDPNNTNNSIKVHFNQNAASILPCIIDGVAATPGALVVGDWGGGGTLVVTNGGSLRAGFANPGGEWTGVGFPNGPGVLYVGTNSTASFGSHLWVGQGTGAEGTVIVDGGTLSILNGQLGVSWNGTGGTNYIVVTNGAKVYLRNWDSHTLGQPGNAASRGQMEISSGGAVIVNGNASSYFPTLVTNGQLTAYGGTGTVSWSFDPVANTTTVVGVPPANANTPVFSAQPTNAIVALGGTATFSVTVGNVACNYQWLFNNQPLADGNGISGSKTANLTIANVTAASSGIYSVWATNKNVSTEAVQSSGASLSTEAFSFYPVVTITGIPGNTYRVDYTTSMAAPVTWTPLTTTTLNAASQFVVDSSSPMSNNRFYRVVLIQP